MADSQRGMRQAQQRECSSIRQGTVDCLGAPVSCSRLIPSRPCGFLCLLVGFLLASVGSLAAQNTCTSPMTHWTLGSTTDCGTGHPIRRLVLPCRSFPCSCPAFACLTIPLSLSLIL